MSPRPPVFEDQENGGVKVQAHMQEALPKDLRPVVTSYMKQYARDAGWRLDVSFKKGYCALSASSRAASSASRKS